MRCDRLNLRNGYTTGACAAAAAGAAVTLLLNGKKQEEAEIILPGGEALTLPIGALYIEKGQAVCGIRKDSGDDPDITNGVMVYAAAEKTESEGIEIRGGIGVGRVTKRGLAIPVGRAAINPGPLTMIEKEVRKVMDENGYADGIQITVSIPEGVRLAAKTFNPRLGIEGGLSVLGTSGIVRPMSEQALLESIRLEMNVVHESGKTRIALTPGNYGETFLTKTLHVDKAYIAQCSNFVYDALSFAERIGFSKVLLCGHIGKFVKLAGGMTNLHSKYGDCRMELLAAFAAAEGANRPVVLNVLNSVTTDEALNCIEAASLLEQTMARMTDRIGFHINAWLDRIASDGSEIRADVVIYSNERGVLGMTDGAEESIKSMKKPEEVLNAGQ